MRNPTNFHTIRMGAAAAIAAIFLTAAPALAVPAFTAQTHQPCSACHVGGFGPHLTPFGRKFKMEGYTMGDDSGAVPLSAMVMSSFVNTQKDQPSPPADHYSTNNNFSMDQTSLFVAGGIGSHVGGFVQITYDGIGRAWGWDNMDLRLVDNVKILGSDTLVGISFNNAPSIDDAWNTLPSWGFPYSGSDLAPGPAAATMFDGGMAQAVLGTTAYADWSNGLYTEAGVYWTPSNRFLSAMGADFGPGPIDGAAPYFRIAYQKDFGAQNVEIGAFGFFPSIYPDGDMSTGQSDSYSDYGFDGSYEYMGNGDNIYTVNMRYTHEEQNLAASVLLGNAAHPYNGLDDFRVDAAYYWHNTIGGTVQFFNTTGTSDPLLYADNRTLSPDSTGLMFQIDGTPWGKDNTMLGGRLNLRVGLQYTVYSRFDGASTNFDGMGHNASDNNTLRIFAWLAL